MDIRSTINGKLEGQSFRVCFLNNFIHKALLVYPNLPSHNSIYYLFEVYIVTHGGRISEMERTRQEAFLPYMWYCAGICLKGLTSTAGWQSPG
jgi:hypothetical protein